MQQSCATCEFWTDSISYEWCRPRSSRMSIGFFKTLSKEAQRSALPFWATKHQVNQKTRTLGIEGKNCLAYSGLVSEPAGPGSAVTE